MLALVINFIGVQYCTINTLHSNAALLIIDFAFKNPQALKCWGSFYCYVLHFVQLAFHSESEAFYQCDRSYVWVFQLGKVQSTVLLY